MSGSGDMNSDTSSPGRGRGRGRGFQKRVQQTNPPSPGTGGSGATNLADKKGLRRPLPETEAQLLAGDSLKPHVTASPAPEEDKNQTKPSSQFSAIVSNSTLSVNAPEFVPRNWVAEQEYIYPDVDVIDQVRETIFALTLRPGSFDDLMKSITETINSWVTDESTIIEIINIIFEQAVTEPNFRYTGARLCGHFSEHLRLKGETGNFRQHMMKRCHQEHLKREELVKDGNQVSRLHGFAMFMGELFLHMKIKVGNSWQRINILGTGLKDVAVTLLSHPTDSNLKCVGQLLKFAGAVLEDEERVMVNKPSGKSMDDIFQLIKKCTVEDSVSKHIKQMMLGVIELRASDWGRAESSPVVKSDAHNAFTFNQDDPFTQPEPVFYDSRGQQITRVQAGFQEEYPEVYSQSDVDEYVKWADPEQYDGYDEYGYDFDQGGMDDEMAAAYDQFVTENESFSIGHWNPT
ncbi:polyadenylate-binding protein-interacting protein 1 [Lingula anatina]|uniref:Polyadenylate-binding protein-interacting protein 1 n=1 Tax=Lingula anatina TaxID=7574 RepID=A0A1S3IVR5_LINAN|nr:polyadenylate-binding protein-interacting protein 1 [Lingula anatina]|eukprot:XP_013402056.1 polyadenylate-binding protein-interacting protein 1 [Lingula anatina]